MFLSRMRLRPHLRTCMYGQHVAHPSNPSKAAEIHAAPLPQRFRDHSNPEGW